MGILMSVVTMKEEIRDLSEQVERLQTQLGGALQGQGKLFLEVFESGRDLAEINAMLEEEIEYRRDLEYCNEALTDQWFSLIMENQHLRTALEQAKQETDQVNDKLSFATEMVGALVLSDAYENGEDD